jgi:3-phenylpropionate/cinnamic acid dioxygenase small subunit
VTYRSPMSAEDADAIRNLLYRYAECIDAADFDGVAALFASATLRAAGMREPLRGADAVRRLYASANRVHPDGTLRTVHLVANPIVEVDGATGRATARSRYVVFQATARLPLQPIVAGRYRDRFERADGAWRFCERLIEIDLVGDLSDHLLFDLAEATRDRP